MTVGKLDRFKVMGVRTGLVPHAEGGWVRYADYVRDLRYETEHRSACARFGTEQEDRANEAERLMLNNAVAASEAEFQLEKLREGLLSDEMLDAICEAALGPYAGPLPRQKLREVLMVALDFTQPPDALKSFEDQEGER